MSVARLFFRGGGLDFQPRRDDRLKERHHRAELGTQLLDGMLLLALALGQEIGAAFLILVNPLLGKAPVANFRKNFLHLLPRLLCHDARAGSVVALLGGIAYGIT